MTLETTHPTTTAQPLLNITTDDLPDLYNRRRSLDLNADINPDPRQRPQDHWSNLSPEQQQACVQAAHQHLQQRRETLEANLDYAMRAALRPNER